MITPITATFPALNFPKEVDYPTQEDWAAFSAAAELNYGILSGTWSDKSEEFKEQTNNLALEIQAIGENAIDAISLDTIEDLATYTGTGLVMVKDINRGGTFVAKTVIEIDPNTGSLYSVNNGTVFSKLGGGFWVRQYSGAVNVKWFGAIDDATVSSARALVSDFGGSIELEGVSTGVGTDLRGRAIDLNLGDSSNYKTDLSKTSPLMHSYVFNGTPTTESGYSHFGTRLDYNTKTGVDVQSSVGFASMMQSYSTNTLGALLGNNTNQVAGLFNSSAMDSSSSAGVEALNAIVYSGYSGTEAQSVIGIEVDLTVTNPAGFFNEAGKSFGVGISSNLTGSNDGSIAIGTGQSGGGTNGWLHGAVIAGCKNTGITIAKQYVSPHTGIWVSAATTYGMYIGAKKIHNLSSVQTPAFDATHTPSIGLALGQVSAINGSSNKFRLVSTNGSGTENTIDIYSDSSNDLQIEMNGVKRFTITPSGNLYINNSQVLTSRITGYSTMTGTANKSTVLATSSVTLEQLAERVKSLQDTLATHGLLGL